MQPNNAVTPEIADALCYGSDHLPVYADFIFPDVTDVSDPEIMLSGFDLSQNYPNPFNPSTVIEYSIPVNSRQSKENGGQKTGFRKKNSKYNIQLACRSGRFQVSRIQNQELVSVQLKVYDILGREVAILVNEHQPPGNYEINFTADNLTSGM